MKVLKENFPYRWCESDNHDSGWIDKFNTYTKRYIKMYTCDSPLQLVTAMDDIDYTRWLDPEGVACYQDRQNDVIKSPYVRN